MLLKNKLTENEIKVLPQAFDIIGDIAQISLPEDLEKKEKLIADAIIKQHKNVKTVVKKVSATKGVKRIRQVEVIAGDKRTETMHKENGCRFLLDLNKVFFTGRLSDERMRVARQVKENEVVVDLFAGIGPYSVLISKMHQDCKVYAIDINRDAVDYLMRNIALNRVKNIRPIHGDSSIVAKKLGRIADRLIMNLPETAYEFLELVPLVAKKGGVVHFYCFLQEEELFDGAVDVIKKKLGDVKIVDKRICGDIAPRTYRVCIDFILTR
jgi:tRNA (guanine37-N1)-methyltransferase